MELSEIEKRMLYQTEGSDKREVFRELLLALRYAGDPARRNAAGDLMEKLRFFPIRNVWRLSKASGKVTDYLKKIGPLGRFLRRPDRT